jgi:hypothetical protein
MGSIAPVLLVYGFQSRSACVMNCPFCGTPKFRTSRVRVSDIPRLAVLQFPVRCRLCRERFYVGFSLALHLLQSQKVREREEEALRMGKYKSGEKKSDTIA